MIKKIYLAGMVAAVLFSVSSCVDNNYDLDDIDTTTAIKVKDLVVPVRLKAITLDQVFDLEDTDLIIKYPEGSDNQYYALSQEGEFDAKDFIIKPLESTNGATIPRIDINLGSISGSINNVSLPSKPTHFTYHLSNVDAAVEKVTNITLSESRPMEITLEFSGDVNNLAVNDLVLEIPENFTGTYKGQPIQNGQVNVGALVKGNLPEPIIITGLDLNAERQGSEMQFEGDLKIVSGVISGSVSSSSDVELKAQFYMSGFMAKKISGSIKYSVESPEIEPVDLGDIPDFLSEPGTNLVLQNPQLYLTVTNPTTAPFSTNLSITPVRDGENRQEIESAVKFLNTVILAPNTGAGELAYENKYPEADKFPWPGLSNILAGDGLPESLVFSLNETQISGDVIDFELQNPDTEDGSYKLGGSYTFFTPLALGEGSKIIYSETESELFGDDVKDIKVDHLRISSVVETDIPFDVTLQLWALDKNGNVLKDVKGNPVTQSATVHDGEMFDLDFNTQFIGLDGVKIQATIDNMNGDTLRPSQSITLNNLKATVSGEYVAEF